MKKYKAQKKDKRKIAIAREENPEHVDWELCADTVDSLHGWIHELCDENKKLKVTLKEVIRRVHDDNVKLKEILEGLNLQGLDSTDSSGR